MNINFTLVVQSINFLIAYVLINKLLLKPIVNIINTEETLEQNINANIDKAKKELEKTENIKILKWQKFQEKFSANSPDIYGFFLENLIEQAHKTIVIKEIDTSKIKANEKDLKDFLVKKVENV